MFLVASVFIVHWLKKLNIQWLQLKYSSSYVTFYASWPITNITKQNT